MLNSLPEEWIPIRSVVGELPLQADGRRVHPSTVARWALYGLGGLKLPSVKLAGRRYVRRDDLRHFLEHGATR